MSGGNTTPSTPAILGDRQRRQNVQRRSPHAASIRSPDCERLEHKCRKERTRRDKMKSSIQRLKDILRESVCMSPQQFAKLENADILELVLLQLKTSSNPPKDTADADGLHDTEHFRSGVDLCATETLIFLQQSRVPPSAHAAHAAVTQRVHNMRSPIATLFAERETVDCAPLVDHSAAIPLPVDGLLLDLRINGADRIEAPRPVCVQQESLPTARHSPARPEVLQKIRRKIFERRQMRSLLAGRNPLAEERTADQLDDGYDSDEALFMWRPW